MKLMFKKHNAELIFKLIILLILLLPIINSQFYYDSSNQQHNIDQFSGKKLLEITQGPANDTTAPTITFIQPETNNTVIRKKSYTIIVNISDENPPLFGDVTCKISNYTMFLFNATMNYEGQSQWSFNWDNISLYPNQYYIGYIIQILAEDSSLNENLGMTGELYIYLNIPGFNPGILNVIIYLLIVCFIIAGIIVFLNRKMLHKISDQKTGNVKGTP